MNTKLNFLENKKEEDYKKSQLIARKLIKVPLKVVLKLATKGKLIIDNNTSQILEKNKPYIFVSTHYHSEDIITNLRALDRQTYALIGTTYQLEHNFQMYGAWLNGLVYVNRKDEESRKESLKIMKWLLEQDVSVLIYPEGGWNNTENLLVNQIFSGAYKLSKETKTEVVPMSNFINPEKNEIHISFGNPIKTYDYSKEVANEEIRDSLATLMFEQIKQYSLPLKRKELSNNYHENFLEERRKEYYKYNTKWPDEYEEFYKAFDEELTVYKPKSIVRSENIINAQNEHLFKWLYDKESNQDFKEYMLKNGPMVRKKAKKLYVEFNSTKEFY